MAIKLKITQVKSGIGRSDTQNRTLEGLGLRGPHKSVVLQDTDRDPRHDPQGQPPRHRRSRRTRPIG